MVITRLHCAGKSFRRYRNFSIRTSYVLQSPKRRGGHRLPLLFLSPFSACPMYAAPERRASPLIQRFLRAAHFARFLNQKPFTLTGGTGSSIQKPHGGIARPEAVCFACFLEQKPFTPTGGTGGSIQKPRWDNAPRSSLLCLLLRAKAFYPHRQNRQFYSKAARWDSAPRSSKLLRGAFWGHTLLYLRYLIRRSRPQRQKFSSSPAVRAERLLLLSSGSVLITGL